MVQGNPSEFRPEIVYADGLVNGAFKTVGAPPQEFEIVNVPVDGGFIKVTVPLTLYCCVALLQAVGMAVTAEILQNKAQGAGAVKFCVNAHVESAEKIAVTEHPAPLAGNPARL